MEDAIQSYMANIEDISVADNTMLEEKSKQESINALLREEYENAIAKLSKREKDIMTLYINERIDFDNYEQMVKIVTSEKNGYIEQLNNIPTETSKDILLTKANVITNFRKNWKALTKGEKLRFLGDYIQKISAVSKKEEGYKVKILKVDFYRD